MHLASVPLVMSSEVTETQKKAEQLGGATWYLNVLGEKSAFLWTILLEVGSQASLAKETMI